MAMEKTFDAGTREPLIYKKWEDAGAFKAGEHMVWAAGVRWRVEAVRPVDRHTIEVDLAGDNGRTLARRLARDRPVGYALDT